MATTSCATSTTSATMTTTPPPMNRKTALASAAGTSQAQKHRPASLRTPLAGSTTTATYPSTIHSPSTSFSAFHNIPPTPVSGVPEHHHSHGKPATDASLQPPASATSFGGGSRTPLTPPSAYLDFLKAVSPSILPSPLSTGTSVHFSFSATSTVSPGLPVPSSASLSGKWTGREKWPRQYGGGSTAGGAAAYASRHGRSTSLSHRRPVLSSHVSEESAASTVGSVSSSDSMESIDSDLSSASIPATAAAAAATSQGNQQSSFSEPQAAAATGGMPTRSVSDSSIPTTNTINAPPVLPTRQGPAGPIRRPSIIIPPSPSTSIPVPVSASDLRSASSHQSPSTTWAASPLKTPRTVSVRQVVTKTVTYNRPAARGGGGERAEPMSRGVGEEQDGEHVAAVATAVETGKVKTEDGGGDGVGMEREGTPKLLVGDAPRGKRRKVD